MNDRKDIQISLNVENPNLRNKFFIYDNKKYPINFNMLKNNSNYFYNNRKKYKNVENIELLSEYEKILNINEESILGFIASCQNEPIQISLSSVIPLQYFAHKFDFQQLTKITTEIIDEHFTELVLPIILFKTGKGKEKFINQPYFNTENEERYVSSHLKQYINEDILLNLSFPVLNRIVKYYSFDCTKEEIPANEMIEFLFKCLNKYGKSASILFGIFDFKEETSNIRDRLLKDYINEFDFYILDSTLDKKPSEIANEMNIKRENFLSVFSQKKKEFNEKCEELILFKEERKQKQKEEEQIFEDKINKLNGEIKSSIEDIENRFKSIEEKFKQMCQEQEKLNEDTTNQMYLQVIKEVNTQ